MSIETLWRAFETIVWLALFGVAAACLLGMLP